MKSTAATTIALSTLAALCGADTAATTPLPPVPQPLRYADAGKEYWAAYRTLHQAITSDNRAELERLLAAGADKALALFIAIDFDRLALAEELLRQGDCVNGKPYARCTVLYALCGKPRLGECSGWGGAAYAVEAYPQQARLVQLALAAGADVNEGSGYSLITPLMQAARSGDIPTIELLLEAGADVNKRDASGLTALSWAARENRTEVVRLLLSRGALVNVPMTSCGGALLDYDRAGCTELHIAALTGSAECIPLLLAAGSAIEAQDMFGRTPFILAARSNSIPTLQALMDGGADIHACSRASLYDEKPDPTRNALHMVNPNAPGAQETRDFLIQAGLNPAN